MEPVFTYNLNSAVYLGYRDITFFPYQPPLRFQPQVPRTLYVRGCESPIQGYTFLNLDSETSRGRGLLAI